MGACYESRVSARICWAAPCAHERQAVHQRTPKQHGKRPLFPRDGEGTDLAWINSVTGNLHLKGKLYEDVETVWIIPDDSIKIKVDGEVMGFITSYEYFDWCLLQTVPAGSLILDGHAVYLGFAL